MTIFEQSHPSFLVRTRAGMCALWEPSRFTHVTDLDAWEDAFDNDESIIKMIKEGAFVPLNVGGSSTFKIDVRSEALTEREQRLRLVTSEPYLLKTEGLIQVGALEEIGSLMGAGLKSLWAKGLMQSPFISSIGCRNRTREMHRGRLPRMRYRISLCNSP